MAALNYNGYFSEINGVLIKSSWHVLPKSPPRVQTSVTSRVVTRMSQLKSPLISPSHSNLSAQQYRDNAVGQVHEWTIFSSYDEASYEKDQHLNIRLKFHKLSGHVTKSTAHFTKFRLTKD